MKPESALIKRKREYNSTVRKLEKQVEHLQQVQQEGQRIQAAHESMLVRRREGIKALFCHNRALPVLEPRALCLTLMCCLVSACHQQQGMQVPLLQLYRQ